MSWAPYDDPPPRRFRERASWQCSERCCSYGSRLCDIPETLEEGEDE